jgi:hypothetical protein
MVSASFKIVQTRVSGTLRLAALGHPNTIKSHQGKQTFDLGQKGNQY